MDIGKYTRVTKKITVWGIVQGVGFRPSVYRLAQDLKINGTIRNIGGFVEIITQSSKGSFDDFLHALKKNPCSGSEITHIEIEDIADIEYQDFKIIESGSHEEISIIPPDLPVCEKCQRELYLPEDRRFHNPFISCMVCGPRYTIMESLPYDRDNTTMQDFAMCPQCQKEYTMPTDRRFHAQTVSCNDCGPYLIMDDLINQEALEKAIEIIKSGGIIAVKGIGGYHFACTPFKEETVQNLRQVKGREEKPFAVMFPNIESIREYCEVSKEQEALLDSRAKPIVLLYVENNKMAKSVGRGSIYCGSFLPYTPLQILLTNRCGPLIMTSANISDKPIIRDDRQMKALPSPYLNGVLYNTRRIVRSVDDSVAKIIDGKPQLIRRSRGYVPYPVFLPRDKNSKQIFAAGGDLKAAFCLYKSGNAVVSQYFGDLEEQAVFEEYQNAAVDLSRLLKIKPDLAVCDLHPNYHSSKYARSLGVPVTYAQHHHAHVASVMAEHRLEGKVIGVAFDGTGYGTDGHIWGGEFLLCEGGEFQRAAHLDYMLVIGGDSSMKDAKKTAACFLYHAGLEDYISDERKAVIKAALEHQINTVKTSSMGRLFDAVSSLLGIQSENRYEGECAALLEKEAVLAVKNGVQAAKINFAIREKDGIMIIDTKPLLEGICKSKESKASLALGFHDAVADLILKVCERLREQQRTDTVALCGGVFQNTVLTERTLKILRENNFKVFYNIAVPPNDGAISLGQAFIGLMRGEKS